MRSSGTISAVRTEGLTPSAARDHLISALSGRGPIALVENERAAEVVEQIHAGDPECVVAVLTSGSTGNPKVVGLSGPALAASITASLVRLRARRGASWSLLLPLHHIAGVQVLLRAALNDGEVGGIDDEVDFTAIVPTQLQRALHGDQRLLTHLRACRSVLVGGSALAPSLRQAAADADVNIVTTYGMSETAGGCIYDGRPLDGVQVRIDSDGRIALHGPMLALGYLNDPAAQQEAFVGNWFRTSDLGSWQHGVLRVAGRADAVINSGGEQLSLPAVERVLLEHPLVIDAIAAGAPDQTWGERLVVGVVASGAVSLAQLRDHVTDHLDRVHAPRGLIVLREIPKTSLGKPDRAALLTHPLDEEI